MIPGEYLLKPDPIEINAGRRTATIAVTNTGDRPIQVGSHCHFFEVNRALRFDRAEAYGMRLDIPSGTAVRFEPGDSREVALVALGGRREVVGVNGLVDGQLDRPEVRAAALAKVAEFTGGGR
jgi:urease beta subunit